MQKRTAQAALVAATEPQADDRKEGKDISDVGEADSTRKDKRKGVEMGDHHTARRGDFTPLSQKRMAEFNSQASHPNCQQFLLPELLDKTLATTLHSKLQELGRHNSASIDEYNKKFVSAKAEVDALMCATGPTGMSACKVNKVYLTGIGKV
ncbi:hypothetical protein BDK51DRAFT_32973 [Blyttiomyces helicus]|uniref:Uncharacterized protein n=1 Tax=Blyttiomyces helicus TaxID=388810 RepID=A0A4P9W1M8_9FUNG|nr:hypothetical protein BDK51DRAFT_32973 [Blyttiomyces helicus]|eukprot:RKO84480.1 hypothetical protein BDK51DRAFT_32973 [Blyttiomyces helicus]